MDLNRYKLDNTYVRAILLLWADGVPWPSGARDRVPGAPTQARFSQLGPRHSVADGHAVLPSHSAVLGYLRAATAPPWLLSRSASGGQRLLTTSTLAARLIITIQISTYHGTNCHSNFKPNFWITAALTAVQTLKSASMVTSDETAYACG